MIVQKQELVDSILKNLSNSDVDMQRWDSLNQWTQIT